MLCSICIKNDNAGDDVDYDVTGTSDFFALNHYTTLIARDIKYVQPTFEKDCDAEITVDQSWTKSVHAT